MRNTPVNEHVYSPEMVDERQKKIYVNVDVCRP